MLELGDVSEDEHQKIADFLEKQDFSETFLVGPQFMKTSTGDKKKKFDTIELLSNYLKTQPIENKFILIKGSRGIRLEKILEVLE
jgi:UDP-N-acetylmuramoyl-tripeptide--D-alanyl-D-alanine ligase